VELDVHDGEDRRTVRAHDAGQALAGLDGAAHVDVVRVRVRRRLQACQPPPRADGSRTEPTNRTLLLADGGSTRAPVHEWAGLAPGSSVEGPALAAGQALPPLHGVPFTVKENLDVAGSATDTASASIEMAMYAIGFAFVEAPRATGLVVVDDATSNGPATL